MNINKIQSVTKFTDLLGQEYNDLTKAAESNHQIHLQFRKYIEEECLRVFSDGKYDKLGTTKAIWDILEFTPECIKNICRIMERK